LKKYLNGNAFYEIDLQSKPYLFGAAYKSRRLVFTESK